MHLGKLGWTESEETCKKRESRARMREFAAQANNRNMHKKFKKKPEKVDVKERQKKSCRERGKAFAKNISITLKNHRTPVPPRKLRLGSTNVIKDLELEHEMKKKKVDELRQQLKHLC